MLLQSKSNEMLIEKVMDEFSAATSLASVVVDIHGTEVSRLCNFTPFCQLIRSNPKYRSLCQKCDMFGGLEASKTGKPLIYRCHAGLTDFSVPIVVENQLSGFLLSGQVICEESSEVGNIQTEETDWKNDKDLISAFRSVPVFSSKKINSSAEMLTIISQYYLKSEMEKSREEQKQKIVFHHTKVAHHEENKEIRKALKYIEKNLNHPITLDEVASHVYLSSYYFSKLFKKEMNVNFINYVNQKKMSLAKEMLKNPRLSIDNIARNLGFTQTSYFCKVFRKEFDVTPKGYRETFK